MVAIDGPEATLLAVADGHNGALAAHAATTAVLALFGDDPPPTLDDKQWREVFERVNASVLAALAPPCAQPASRTVLLLALIAGDVVSWGGLGDAALVIAAPGDARGRQLNKESARYVGYPMSRRVDQERGPARQRPSWRRASTSCSPPTGCRSSWIRCVRRTSCHACSQWMAGRRRNKRRGR